MPYPRVVRSQGPEFRERDIDIYISKEHFVFPFLFIRLITFSVLVNLYFIPYRCIYMYIIFAN